MKKKDLKSLREKSVDELKSLVIEKRNKIIADYAKIRAGKEKNTSLLRKLKRDLAQTLTILREKGIIEKYKADKKQT
jgi:ribosomal protein L29